MERITLKTWWVTRKLMRKFRKAGILVNPVSQMCPIGYFWRTGMFHNTGDLLLYFYTKGILVVVCCDGCLLPKELEYLHSHFRKIQVYYNALNVSEDLSLSLLEAAETATDFEGQDIPYWKVLIGDFLHLDSVAC